MSNMFLIQFFQKNHEWKIMILCVLFREVVGITASFFNFLDSHQKISRNKNRVDD